MRFIVGFLIVAFIIGAATKLSRSPDFREQAPDARP